MISSIAQLPGGTNCNTAAAVRSVVCELRNSILIPIGGDSQGDILITRNTLSGAPNLIDVRRVVSRLAIDLLLGVTAPATVRHKAEHQGDTVVLAPADTAEGTTGRLQVDRAGKVQELSSTRAFSMAVFSFYIPCGQRLLDPGLVPISMAVASRNQLALGSLQRASEDFNQAVDVVK